MAVAMLRRAAQLWRRAGYSPMSEQMPRYAIAEIERRWLVDATAVADLALVPFRRYEDLYIDGSRLRLRKITEPNGSRIFKLSKKYGKRSVLSEPITTLYLDEAEYDRLRHLPGSPASKRRYTIAGGSLDVYEQPIPGFVVFELEFENEEAARNYQPPPFVTREITAEAGYSGFQLSRAHSA
jgi:CYTH domain-containing protein